MKAARLAEIAPCFWIRFFAKISITSVTKPSRELMCKWFECVRIYFITAGVSSLLYGDSQNGSSCPLLLANVFILTSFVSRVLITVCYFVLMCRKPLWNHNWRCCFAFRAIFTFTSVVWPWFPAQFLFWQLFTAKQGTYFIHFNIKTAEILAAQNITTKSFDV